ncbi:MAG: prolyl-tRNA synthetase associated domain-containing protein [Candidatus Babeliales bacterium]
MTQEQKLYELFDELGIAYTIYEHEALFTVDQAQEAEKNIPGTHCKNLFLKDDKKRFWLLVAYNRAAVDLRKIAHALNAKGLRFAQPELLDQYLGLKPGSVTPFGLINDTERAVHVILDENLLKSELVGFHPLRNTATVTLMPQDLLKFLKHQGNALSVYTL